MGRPWYRAWCGVLQLFPDEAIAAMKAVPVLARGCARNVRTCCKEMPPPY